MTYAEKLKDPRWINFRDSFLSSIRRERMRESPEGDCEWCEGCGETANPFHVHHRIYINGREPWEYSFDCLSALCAECHRRIHSVEKFARRLILESDPHVLYELEEFLKEFEKCDNRKLTARLAYRAAIRVQEAERSGANMGVEGILEMARNCARRYSAMVEVLENGTLPQIDAQEAFYGE